MEECRWGFNIVLFEDFSLFGDKDLLKRGKNIFIIVYVVKNFFFWGGKYCFLGYMLMMLMKKCDVGIYVYE